MDHSRPQRRTGVSRKPVGSGDSSRPAEEFNVLRTAAMYPQSSNPYPNAMPARHSTEHANDNSSGIDAYYDTQEPLESYNDRGFYLGYSTPYAQQRSSYSSQPQEPDPVQAVLSPTSFSSAQEQITHSPASAHYHSSELPPETPYPEAVYSENDQNYQFQDAYEDSHLDSSDLHGSGADMSSSGYADLSGSTYELNYPQASNPETDHLAAGHGGYPGYIRQVTPLENPFEDRYSHSPYQSNAMPNSTQSFAPEAHAMDSDPSVTSARESIVETNPYGQSTLNSPFPKSLSTASVTTGGSGSIPPVPAVDAINSVTSVPSTVGSGIAHSGTGTGTDSGGMGRSSGEQRSSMSSANLDAAISNSAGSKSISQEQRDLGIGVGSDYIRIMRIKAGETHSLRPPALLPRGLKGAGNAPPTLKVPPVLLRKAMDIRYTHLQPRMLASEVDDDGPASGSASNNTPDSALAPSHHHSGGNLSTVSASSAKSGKSGRSGRTGGSNSTGGDGPDAEGNDSPTALKHRSSSPTESVREDLGKIKLFVANPDDESD